MTEFVYVTNMPSSGGGEPATYYPLEDIKSNLLSYVIGFIVLIYFLPLSKFELEFEGLLKYTLLTLAYFISAPFYLSFQLFYFSSGRYIRDIKWSIRILLGALLFYFIIIALVSIYGFFTKEEWFSQTVNFFNFSLPYALYITWCFEINAKKYSDEYNLGSPYYENFLGFVIDMKNQLGMGGHRGQSVILTIISPALMFYIVCILYKNIYSQYNLLYSSPSTTNLSAVEYRWQVTYLVFYCLILGLLILYRCIYNLAAMKFIDDDHYY